MLGALVVVETWPRWMAQLRTKAEALHGEKRRWERRFERQVGRPPRPSEKREDTEHQRIRRALRRAEVELAILERQAIWRGEDVAC